MDRSLRIGEQRANNSRSTNREFYVGHGISSQLALCLFLYRRRVTVEFLYCLNNRFHCSDIKRRSNGLEIIGGMMVLFIVLDPKIDKRNLLEMKIDVI